MQSTYFKHAVQNLADSQSLNIYRYMSMEVTLLQNTMTDNLLIENIVHVLMKILSYNELSKWRSSHKPP